ncbi:MAG: hypothetical protein HY761_00815 [Candidatus Omnitrophica bacterium]|nr:hypothetical protein [Candidatus Omnitrophota bacterium]
MIKTVKLSKELVVTVINKIGILADMSKIVSDHGLNIEAVAGYATNNEAKVMIVTDDNLRAGDALRKAGYNSIKENEIIILELENKSGALRQITSSLAASGIDIKQVYGTACTAGCPAKIVLSTSNNEKAFLVFKK